VRGAAAPGSDRLSGGGSPPAGAGAAPRGSDRRPLVRALALNALFALCTAETGVVNGIRPLTVPRPVDRSGAVDS
jgi:hypothetical protein